MLPKNTAIETEMSDMRERVTTLLAKVPILEDGDPLK